MEESENNLETMMENLFFTGSPRPKRMVSDVNLLRDSEKEVKIGEEYQAKLPTLLKEEEKKTYEDREDKDVPYWWWTEHLSESSVDNYLRLARTRGFTEDQSLGLLAWHQMDLAAAMADLPHIAPLPDTWTEQEKQHFAQALEIFKKDFIKIKTMLPGKTMKELVLYYYSVYIPQKIGKHVKRI